MTNFLRFFVVSALLLSGCGDRPPSLPKDGSGLGDGGIVPFKDGAQLPDAPVDSAQEPDMPVIPDGGSMKMVPCDEDNDNPANSADEVVDVPIVYDPATDEWSAPAPCNWRCDGGYCEHGDQCLDTRQVACDESGVPANADATSVMVSLTCTNGGWSSAAECEWSCATGYCEHNDACLDSRSASCDSSGTPSNATADVTNVTIACDSGNWAAPADCAWSCNNNFCLHNGACLGSRSVTCDSSGTPANATATPSNVTITCNGDSWRPPAACTWTCDPGYCRQGGGCVVMAPGAGYETAVSPAGKWFGGDARTTWHNGDSDPDNNRNVAVGQSVPMTTNLALKAFAFNFAAAFPAGEVLVLNLRDASGALLETVYRTAQANDAPGWFYWPIEYDLQAGQTYIFTAYMRDGLSSTFWTSVRGDSDASRPGTGYNSTVYYPNEDLQDWSEWTTHTWDFLYLMRGCPLP